MPEQPRPAVLSAVAVKVPTDHGNMYVVVSYETDKVPFEVFVHMGRAGSCEHAWIEAATRSISVGLRHGVPASVYIDQLRGVSCRPVADGDGWIRSPADGIAKVLEDFVEGRFFGKPKGGEVKDE